MNTTIRVLSALALLLVVGPFTAAASDHLQPSASYAVAPDLYDRMLSEVFAPFYENRDLKLAVLVVPSFKPERAVGIQQQDGNYHVVTATARQSIWAYVDIESYEASQRGEPHGAMIEESDYKERRAQLPGRYRDVPLDEASAPLDAQLAKRISGVWQSALLATKQPVSPKVGFDGTAFTFSMWVYGYGVVSGSTWSPEAGTDMHSLVALAVTMGKYARGQKSVADVEQAVGECEKRLVNNKPAADSEQSDGRKK